MSEVLVRLKKFSAEFFSEPREKISNFIFFISSVNFCER